MNAEPHAFFQMLMRLRWFRRFWYFLERLVPFVRVSLTENGLGSRKGRTLIWGKARRLVLSAVPPLARALQRHYGLKGGCQNCGASCQLLFKCPHWDDRSRLCSVYQDRPNICRLFPITPADIRDRNLVAGKSRQACGYNFAPRQHQNPELVPAPAVTPSTPSFPRD